MEHQCHDWLAGRETSAKSYTWKQNQQGRRETNQNMSMNMRKHKLSAHSDQTSMSLKRTWTYTSVHTWKVNSQEHKIWPKVLRAIRWQCREWRKVEKKEIKSIRCWVEVSQEQWEMNLSLIHCPSIPIIPTSHLSHLTVRSLNNTTKPNQDCPTQSQLKISNQYNSLWKEQAVL